MRGFGGIKTTKNEKSIQSIHQMDRGKLSADRFINFDGNGIRWNVRVVVVDQLHHNTGPTNSISINDSERRPESTQQQWRHIYF